MTSIVIVDDQEMIRLGLRAILSVREGYEVVQDFPTAAEAVHCILTSPPNIVLMDIRMPGMDGIEATREIQAAFPPERVGILILTTFEHDANVIEALHAGANGFLSKGASAPELIAAIDEVLEGGPALSRAATRALVTELRGTSRPSVDEDLRARFSELTPRERAVVVAVADGSSNEEIAASSFVSPYTVKTQVLRAMTKVGARDRAQLVAFAHRARLVE